MTLEGVGVKKEPDDDRDALLTLKCAKDNAKCNGSLAILTDTYCSKELCMCDGLSLLTCTYCTEEEPNCDTDSLTNTDSKEEPEYGVSAAAVQAGLYDDHQVKEELVLGPELVQPKTDAAQVLLSLSQVETCKQEPEVPQLESTCSRQSTLRDCFVELERIPIDKLHNKLGRRDRHAHVEDDKSENSNNKSGNATKRIYICNTCSRQFAVRKLFILHLRSHKSDKYFGCNVCGRNFSEKIDLRRHSLVHMIDKETSTCSTCNKQFVTRSALINHIRKHLGENTCEICYKSFASIHSLDRHRLIHTGDKPFTCDMCQTQFRYRGDLVAHIREQHSGKPREKHLSCDICSKQFAYLFHLLEHKRSHSREKPFECDMCKKRYMYRNNLKKHKWTHTKERPFPCDLCNKHFVRRDRLMEHKLSHTGEKPFTCEICKKAFRSREYIVYHLRIIHSQANNIKPSIRSQANNIKPSILSQDNNIKRHSCEICENMFRTKSHLIRHIRTHTREKPFTCYICEKSFSHKTTLTSHMRTHTGERPYACDMCSHRCTTSGNLLQHKRKAHCLAK